MEVTVGMRMPDGPDPEQGNFYSFRNETGVIVAWPRRRQLPQRSLVSASEIGPSDLKRSMILAAGRLIVRPQAHTIRMSTRAFSHSPSAVNSERFCAGI